MGPWGEFTVFKKQLEQRGCKAAFVFLSTYRPSTVRYLESLKSCSVSIKLNLYVIASSCTTGSEEQLNH